MRLIFILKGLRTNRTCRFGGRNLLRTPMKRAETERRSPSGLPVQPRLNRHNLFLMKQQTLNDICTCSGTTSCCNLRKMPCPYRHSSLCKMVPRSILPKSCWTSATLFFVIASCQTAIWIVTNMGTLGQLSFLI